MLNDSWGTPDAVAVDALDGEWEAVPTNGWHLLFAWIVGELMGPDHVRLMPSDHTGRTVRVVIEHADGRTERYSRPINREDLDDERMMAAEYLSDASIPMPPEGTAVHLKLPVDTASLDDAMDLASEAIGARGLETLTPADTASAFRLVIAPLYGRGA